MMPETCNNNDCHPERVDLRSRLDAAETEIKQLREVINEGAGCCLCELDRWGIEVSRCQVHTELEALREALAALLKFNKELCEDVGVSTHYPSADKAHKLLARQ